MLPLSGHFIPSGKYQILLTQFGELGKTAVLCLPSITEELNLARSVMASQARYFAENGLSCVVLDYAGTGDSQGEFEQMTADDWVDDIIQTGQWMTAQGVENIVLWGIRFGSLLAMANQKKLIEALPVVAQLHWKPVTSGKQFASQFLRIKQANSMMSGTSTTKVNWREHILAGNATEIAGYRLSAAMLGSIDKLVITKNYQPAVPFGWLELATATPTPAITRVVEPWHENQYTISCVNTPAFWQIPEVFDLPEIYPTSYELLQKLGVQ